MTLFCTGPQQDTNMVVETKPEFTTVERKPESMTSIHVKCHLEDKSHEVTNSILEAVHTPLRSNEAKLHPKTADI